MMKEKLNIEKKIEIDRCHRAGKKQNKRPRTIFCRITKFKDKHLVLKNSIKLKILYSILINIHIYIIW